MDWKTAVCKQTNCFARGPLKQRKEQRAQSSTLLDQGAEAFLASGSHDQHKIARRQRFIFLCGAWLPRQSMHTLLISHTFSFSMQKLSDGGILDGTKRSEPSFFPATLKSCFLVIL
jgi:hypothetical protein